MITLMKSALSHRTILTATLAGLVAFGGPASASAQAPAPTAQAEKEKTKDQGKKGTVPFEMLATNHMVVRAKLNGKGPFDLIFDVGAPITLLTNKASLESGTIKADAPRSFLFSIRGESEVKKLEMGEMTAEDVPVIVLDHPLLKAMGDMLDRPLDGIIGYTFFARYRTTIDYQARKMTFEPVDGPVRNLMKDLPDRLAGPRVARHRTLAPGGLWGLSVGDPVDGLNSSGVPIMSVVADSPAATAGLKPGDVLTTLDGRWTTSITDAYAAAAGVPAGREAPVVVLRDGKELTLTVKPVAGL
ncbi:PDZ domain-containing protein [Singulisphaera sp. Ch08]|uniref:PDZ domain-containing protein n=1 Tax=Singulisphaera sp. Ch08 TaxID=3120278 RepID=A0AAU7CL57_9BACT